MKTLEERFWEKVDIKDDDECWEWLAGKGYAGYGHFHISGEGTRYAHRIAWELYHKKKIPKDKQVNHSCDNSSCCNPRHLKLGTNRDNVRDMINKGRRFTTVGEKHPMCKLTNKQIIRIRKLASLIKKDGTRVFSQQDLADNYKVVRQHINRIVNYQRRKDI